MVSVLPWWAALREDMGVKLGGQNLTRVLVSYASEGYIYLMS